MPPGQGAGSVPLRGQISPLLADDPAQFCAYRVAHVQPLPHLRSDPARNGSMLWRADAFEGKLYLGGNHPTVDLDVDALTRVHPLRFGLFSMGFLGLFGVVSEGVPWPILCVVVLQECRVGFTAPAKGCYHHAILTSRAVPLKWQASQPRSHGHSSVTL